MTDPQVLCPYNGSHKFKQSKLVWHIGRCKDKLKVQHLYAKCEYNPLHIFRKNQMSQHEKVCTDRKRKEDLIKGLKGYLKCKQESSISYESDSLKKRESSSRSDSGDSRSRSRRRLIQKRAEKRGHRKSRSRSRDRRRRRPRSSSSESSSNSSSSYSRVSSLHTIDVNQAQVQESKNKQGLNQTATSARFPRQVQSAQSPCLCDTQEGYLDTGFEQCQQCQSLLENFLSQNKDPESKILRLLQKYRQL